MVTDEFTHKRFKGTMLTDKFTYTRFWGKKEKENRIE